MFLDDGRKGTVIYSLLTVLKQNQNTRNRIPCIHFQRKPLRTIIKNHKIRNTHRNKDTRNFEKQGSLPFSNQIETLLQYSPAETDNYSSTQVSTESLANARKGMSDTLVNR